MKVRLRATIVLFALLFGAPNTCLPQGHEQQVLALYYCGGCGAASAIDSLPVSQLTDIIYAFGEPNRDDLCAPPNSQQLRQFSALRSLRASHPNLHLLLSIGGWAAAPQYSDIALTAASRRAFVQSCIAWYVKQDGFDGIDIDWEFPVRGGVPENPRRPQDRADVTLLLREFRSQFDALTRVTHRNYLLTAATPTGTWEYGGAYSVSQSYDLQAVAAIVDWLNVMTYDMNNIFSPVSNFHTAMRADPRDPTPYAQRRWDTLTGAVRFYEAHGVPPEKIVLGAAFYGRGFTGVSSRNAGLYSHYTGGFDETPWTVVETRFLPDPAWERHWSDVAQVPWLFNARRHIFFAYDDPESMRIKGAFVRDAGLRGAMIWVAGEDDARNSLLNALARGMGR